MDNNTDPNQAPVTTQPSEQLLPKPVKKQKFMALLIIVILVMAGLLVWAGTNNHNKKTVTPAQNTQVNGTPNSAQVGISSEAFDPATLNVPINTQVTWKNNDTAAHQVAADPYPKDDSITGFNNHIVLQKGETYSFMFTKAGTYKYHDELNPLKINGTIVVE